MAHAALSIPLAKEPGPGAAPAWPPCAICGGSDFVPLKMKMRDWEYGVAFESRLVECRACHLVTHSPPISADQIAGLYPDNYLAHSGGARRRGVYGALKQLLRARTARLIARQVPPGGAFMEVGCGDCQLIRDISLCRPDITLLGVDIKKVDVAPIERFTFLQGQLEEVQAPPASVDLVYCSNLIEHVADPRRFLDKVLLLLKPGGAIHGVTPDHLSLDRVVFGRYWAGYHYPRHTFVFNHDNIATLLRSAGFEAPTTSGSYSFWYLSLANLLLELPGTKKRGLAFAAVTSLFLPLDLLLNRVTTHGSMTFHATKPSASM